MKCITFCTIKSIVTKFCHSFYLRKTITNENGSIFLQTVRGVPLTSLYKILPIGILEFYMIKSCHEVLSLSLYKKQNKKAKCGSICISMNFWQYLCYDRERKRERERERERGGEERFHEV